MKPTIRVPYFEIGTKNYVWAISCWNMPSPLTKLPRNMISMCCFLSPRWKSAVLLRIPRI